MRNPQGGERGDKGQIADKSACYTVDICAKSLYNKAMPDNKVRGKGSCDFYQAIAIFFVVALILIVAGLSLSLAPQIKSDLHHARQQYNDRRDAQRSQ